MRPGATIRERLAAALSGAAAVLLSAGGAWYFVSAVWWLLRHHWPGWTWARLGMLEGTGGAAGFLAGLSPGATALLLAAILAIVSRIIDPARRRR